MQGESKEAPVLGELLALSPHCPSVDAQMLQGLQRAHEGGLQ